MDLLDQTPENNSQEKNSSDMPDLEALMNPTSSEHSSSEKNPKETKNYGVFDASKSEDTSPTHQTMTAHEPHEIPPSLPEEPELPTPISPPPPHKGGIPRGILFAVIALFLITLPVIGYFVNQQQELADTRSKAAGICCDGGSCNDGWSYGPDSNAPQGSCEQRRQEACAGRGGPASGGGSCSAPQPTSPPNPTVPPSGCPVGQIACAGCINSCRPNTQTCNQWIQQECQQQGCAGNGVFANGQQCCSGLQLCGNGRCGTTCVAQITATPVPPTSAPVITPTPRTGFYCENEIAAMCNENGESCVPTTGGGRCAPKTGCIWTCGNDCATQQVVNSFNATWCNGQAQWKYESAITQGLSGSSCGGSPSQGKTNGCNTPTAPPTQNTCSTSSDSFCIGRGYNSSCTINGFPNTAGTCVASSITGSDGKKICACNSGPTLVPNASCTVPNAQTCIQNTVYKCLPVTGQTNILVYQQVTPVTSCSISCNASSATSCVGKTISSACSTLSGSGTCQQNTVDSAGNPTCGCSIQNQPTQPQTNPTNSPNSCSSGGQSCESTGCCSGFVCQGQSGSRVCQPQTANVCPGSVCAGRLIAFHCTSWFGSECLDNPIYIENGNMAAALAHVNGCGQVDQVCSGGANENKLCGDFNIIKTNCGNNPTSPPSDPVLASCQNIKIYKGGVMLTSNQYNSIKPGDQLTFAAVTAPSVTQARFTINSGIPQVTTTKNNAGELVTNYTVPQVTVVTQFTVQAEIFSDGQWR